MILESSFSNDINPWTCHHSLDELSDIVAISKISALLRNEGLTDSGSH
ncbi:MULTISPECIES: hypothetical protein [unclassified Sphingobacterium]|nr:hypothetical protein [Sphingobacterium sp. UGAL515B_05]WON96659.1 hypothetical protein OK025_09670 [Sphingobacterium sp. UGAL515B_05]